MHYDGKARFRWVTVQKALDLLQSSKNNAEIVAFIEEIGCGPEYDTLALSERTTPKLRNLISKACRENPPRMDSEGSSLIDRTVQEAARCLQAPVPKSFWDKSETPMPPQAVAFLSSLALDGWSVKNGDLIPNTPIPIDQPRSRLKSNLLELGGEEPLRRLGQLEKGLDDAHWESANADTRGFLNSVFDLIFKNHPNKPAQEISEGNARLWLQQQGFFKLSSKDPKSSFEGNFVKSLIELLGSEGAHVGRSDEETAVFRYAVSILVVDYFLMRSIKLR